MTATATTSAMEELLSSAPDFVVPKPGTLVDGSVISIYKNKILVDLNGGITTGLITGREAKDSGDTIKKLKIGDTISAYVIDEENEEGYVLLSLRKASQERTWKKFEDAYQKTEVIHVVATEANKGGLLLEIDGIKAFIPVSQLAPMHYPRVNGADTNQILHRLQELVGTKFSVKIINIDKENGKLILSEKAAMEEQRKAALAQLQVGSVVDGSISGIVKFGIFVAFDGLEGLVHISEIAWGHVKNAGDYGKLGDKIKVMIIGIDGEKISLSMKRLVEDPWLGAVQQFKIGDTVEGEINRLTPFGAFLKLTDDINGLIHVSEITDKQIKDPAEVLKLGDKVKARIIAIEPSEHRVGLSMKAPSETRKASQESAADGTEAEKSEEKKPAKKKIKKVAEKEESEEKEKKPSKKK